MVYDDERILRRIIKVLKRHGEIKAVAILALVENKAGLRGIRNISKDTVIIKGYMPLPAP